MNLQSLAHRFGQVERDLRRRGVREEPESPWRARLELASRAELRELRVALQDGNLDEPRRISAVLDDRFAKGEPAPPEPKGWKPRRRAGSDLELTPGPTRPAGRLAPPLTVKALELEEDARATGGTVLYAGTNDAGDDIFVKLAFDPFGDCGVPADSTPSAGLAVSDRAAMSPPPPDPAPPQERVVEASPAVPVKRPPEPLPEANVPAAFEWRSQGGRDGASVFSEIWDRIW